jgi:hypothetical protein
MFDQQTTHTKLDSVALVGRDSLLPERLRHDAEHRSAVKLLAAGLNRMNREPANLAALDAGCGWRHASLSALRPSRVPMLRVLCAVTPLCRA